MRVLGSVLVGVNRFLVDNPLFFGILFTFIGVFFTFIFSPVGDGILLEIRGVGSFYFLDSRGVKIFELWFLVGGFIFTLNFWRIGIVENRKKIFNLLVRELIGNIKLLGPFIVKGVELRNYEERNSSFPYQMNEILVLGFSESDKLKFRIPADDRVEKKQFERIYERMKDLRAFFRSDWESLYDDHRYNLFPLMDNIIKKIKEGDNYFFSIKTKS